MSLLVHIFLLPNITDRQCGSPSIRKYKLEISRCLDRMEIEGTNDDKITYP
jgi:hypothetical protein